jgi:site-specific DNA recombinase
MLRKAREGRVVVTRPAYGFRYNEARDALVICESEMAVVEKVLRLAADGLGQHAIHTRLFREGVPSPTGKPQWDWSMIKKIVYNDAYRPHTFKEISALLAPEVAATLDPDKEYGVQWYNRQRVTERTVSEPDAASPSGRSYRKTRTFKWRPREEWIAAPVPPTFRAHSWISHGARWTAGRGARGSTRAARGSCEASCAAGAGGRCRRAPLS